MCREASCGSVWVLLLVQNNNKVKGHLCVNGSIRPCVAERDQYLMNSKRRSFRNINVSYTWVHKVTSADRWIWHYTQPEECIFLIDLSIFKLIPTTIKMDRTARHLGPGLWESFLLCAGITWWPGRVFNYRCLLSAGSGTTTETTERLRLAFSDGIILR